MNTQSSIYNELSNVEIKSLIENNFGIGNEYEAKLLSGGLFNTTYLITLLSSQRKLVLRIGPVNRHLLLPFEDNLMDAEDYVYKLCKYNGVACSNVVICDTTRKIIDRDYMFVDYIPSSALSELEVSEQTMSSLYKQTGFYTAKLHKITNIQFGRVSQIVKGIGFSSWSEYLKEEISQWNSKVITTEIYKKSELSLIDEVFEKYKDLLDEIKTPHLVHADLWAGNVLVSQVDNDYKVVAIIDVDRTIFGDIDFEFASPWMINDDFLEGYGANISQGENSETRKKIYRLIYNLLDSYVWLAEYNNKEYSEENKKSAMEIVKQLLNGQLDYETI